MSIGYLMIILDKESGEIQESAINLNIIELLKLSQYISSKISDQIIASAVVSKINSTNGHKTEEIEEASDVISRN